MYIILEHGTREKIKRKQINEGSNFLKVNNKLLGMLKKDDVKNRKRRGKVIIENLIKIQQLLIFFPFRPIFQIFVFLFSHHPVFA